MKCYSIILLLFCSFFSHGQVNSANIKIDSITSLQLVREKFNPEKPINNSPNNTGLQELPAAQKAFIW